MPNIEALPKWAQSLVADLKHRVETAELQTDSLVAQIKEYESRQGTDVITLEPYRSMSERTRSQLFPVQSVVRIGNPKIHRQQITIIAEADGWVDVSAGDSLEVRPRAGNVIKVRSVPFK